MSVTKADYETLLAEYSSAVGALSLLKQYPPYFETVPSIRRPEQSLITIPLPLVRLRRPDLQPDPLKPVTVTEALALPCDLGILMCDPEWQIKLETEILVFIHRPAEDFSDLIDRWRQTQVYLTRNYEWLMPPGKQHIVSEGADRIHPLFVIFTATNKRIRRGLTGASLPFVVSCSDSSIDEVSNDLSDSESDIEQNSYQ